MEDITAPSPGPCGVILSLVFLLRKLGVSVKVKIMMTENHILLVNTVIRNRRFDIPFITM